MSLVSRQSDWDVCYNLSPSEPAATGSAPLRRRTLAIAGEVIADVGLPLLSGALVALSFMGPPLDVLAWVALVPFAAAMARPLGTVELYLGAYLGGALVHLHVLDFIRTRFGGSGLFASHEADWLANGLAWALVWPLVLFVGRRFVRQTWLPMLVALPIVWIAGEYLRQEAGWIVLQVPFPWLQIGTTQATYPRLIQVADLAGPWAVAAAIAAVNGALFDALCTRRVKPIVFALGILVAALLYGEFRLRETQTERGPSVSLVPPSMQPHEACQKPPRSDVLLWSETTFQGSLPGPESATIRQLEADSRSAGATLCVGCVRQADGSRYNSAIVVDPLKGSLGFYDKQFLVPWSEFTPWSWPGSDVDRHAFSPGTARPVFPVAGFTCGASICYDACFDRSCRGYSDKPDFFAAASRESSDISGYIRRAMLDFTRFRAVENRRAFVRNVEDGFSGIVTSTGEYIAAPEQPWKAPVSVGRVPIDDRWTLSRVAGDWLAWLCCAIVAVAIVRPRRRSDD